MTDQGAQNAYESAYDGMIEALAEVKVLQRDIEHLENEKRLLVCLAFDIWWSGL